MGSEKHTDVSARGESSNTHDDSNGLRKESKLELFGFDSLVNILGLKSMTGEQIPAPPSPRDGEDISIAHGHPKPTGPKLGTMMGVFVPCLQNILGIIYYIRFSWIVGMAGIGESLLLVAFCGSCTFLTSISLSAIATNGAMKWLGLVQEVIGKRHVVNLLISLVGYLLFQPFSFKRAWQLLLKTDSLLLNWALRHNLTYHSQVLLT